jgi:predicted nucleic acid-binding protein
MSSPSRCVSAPIRTSKIGSMLRRRRHYGCRRSACPNCGRRRNGLAAALERQIVSLFEDRIIPFDAGAAEAYAEVVTLARAKGCAISMADGQIAAIASSRNLTIASRDEVPFHAAGLGVINPWTAEL